MSEKTKKSAIRHGEMPAQVADVYDAVDAALKDHEAAKNTDFKMIFPAGWRRIQRLAHENPTSLRLWAFLAEHAGPNGALLISQADLAAAIGVTTRTIRSLVRRLESAGALITLREAGGCVYCLNPREIWALAADKRRWAPFSTRAIFSEHARGALRKRLTVATFRGEGPQLSSLSFENLIEPTKTAQRRSDDK